MLQALAARGVVPDVVTDQTPPRTTLNGYVPGGLTFEAAAARSRRRTMSRIDTGDGRSRPRDARARPPGQRVRLQQQHPGQAEQAGVSDAFDIPGFVPEYIRPLFCEGKGPFRWAALSGDPSDIAATDRAVLELFPQDEALARWIRLAGERVKFQGLPARICWLGYGERARFGLKINEMVAGGELKAPIVIGRDHLDAGSVASPNRETEAMKDGSDAIGDWPVLNALINTACGATWVSIHHGGGVGIGYSLHAGMVCVADGSPMRTNVSGACSPATRDGRRAARRCRLSRQRSRRGDARHPHADGETGER